MALVVNNQSGEVSPCGKRWTNLIGYLAISNGAVFVGQVRLYQKQHSSKKDRERL